MSVGNLWLLFTECEQAHESAETLQGVCCHTCSLPKNSQTPAMMTHCQRVMARLPTEVAKLQGIELCVRFDPH